MPTAPEGFCNSLNDSNWVQNLLNLIAKGVAKFEGSGFTAIINSETQPAATDRDKLWRKPSEASRGLYEWDAGAWVIAHPETPSGDARRWWIGTLVDLQTYDGGSVGAVAANTGPMWEEDTDFQGRSPMGPGTIPDILTALAVAANTGVGQVTLTSAQMSLLLSHQHVTGRFVLPTNDDTYDVIGGVADPYPGAGALIGRQQTGDTGANPQAPLSTFTGEYEITGPPYDPASSTDSASITNTAHTNVPPVRGLYCIKRTARINYVGS